MSFEGDAATLTRPSAANLFSDETVDVLPVELKPVPKSFSGVTELTAYSGQPFYVNLDGKRIGVYSLHVIDPRPLEVRRIRGMKGATVTEYDFRTNIVEMLPINGSFTVTGDRIDPALEILDRKKKTGRTVYTDPDEVVVYGVDGKTRTYRHLSKVEVNGLTGDGRVICSYSV